MLEDATYFFRVISNVTAYHESTFESFVFAVLDLRHDSECFKYRHTFDIYIFNVFNFLIYIYSNILSMNIVYTCVWNYRHKLVAKIIQNVFLIHKWLINNIDFSLQFLAKHEQ